MNKQSTPFPILWIHSRNARKPFWFGFNLSVCSLIQHLATEFRLASCLNQPCAVITEVQHHAWLGLSTSPTSTHCSSLTNHCASMPLNGGDHPGTAKVIPQNRNTRPGTRKKPETVIKYYN